jgi:YHS domain-containing protein
MKKSAQIFFVIFTWVLINSSVLLAQDESAKRLKSFNISSSLAIQGYDPVGYFVSNKAIKGKKELAYTYKGIHYYFSSQTNLNSFKQNPAKYEPAYGGWCAYAMGENGKKVAIDPGTFKIKDGKLLLFYNFWGTNTLKSWDKDEANLYKKAEVNWKKTYN